ncbi:MAG TPA: LptF/LptG family permease, partial [Helicobacteraceae bacterium]|nr:LptF/LptG family permease [Helicobacteraceae bacterium]
MYRLRRYLLKNLSLLFLSIFIPLFAIASIIFLIKLATYTSVIQLSVKDMVTLYLFVLPEVFFYTLPVTFFIAASISLYRLSQENESTVLFALGITPATIYAIYFRPAILLSLLLFFDFFVMFPHATVLSTNYLRYKQSEAQFNLQASEYGHSFGDWMLYIGSAKSDNLYSDVFLFKNDPNEELLINANEASIVNSGNVLSLKLESGKGYNFKKNILTQMNFQTLYIN